jgi:hypothetical protein
MSIQATKNRTGRKMPSWLLPSALLLAIIFLVVGGSVTNNEEAPLPLPSLPPNAEYVGQNKDDDDPPVYLEPRFVQSRDDSGAPAISVGGIIRAEGGPNWTVAGRSVECRPGYRNVCVDFTAERRVRFRKVSWSYWCWFDRAATPSGWQGTCEAEASGGAGRETVIFR